MIRTLLFLVLCLVVSRAEDAELSKMVAEYVHRKAEAVKPVDVWFEIQLTKELAARKSRGDVAGMILCQTKLLALHLDGKTFSWATKHGKADLRFTTTGECEQVGYWTAKWEFEAADAVIVTLPDETKFHLKFHNGFTSMSGTDVDGKSPITGKLK